MISIGHIGKHTKACFKITLIALLLILLSNPFTELDSMCGYYGISIFYDQKIPHNPDVDVYLGCPSTFEFRETTYMSYSLGYLKSLGECKPDEFELISYIISNNNLFLCERNIDGEKRYQILGKGISSSGEEYMQFENIDIENMLEKIDIQDYTYINADFEYIRGIRNSRDFCLYAICILTLMMIYNIVAVIKLKMK